MQLYDPKTSANSKPSRDKVLGCIVGGAIGDALGAPVEFLSKRAIIAQYGPEGIQEFDRAYGRKGAITDDTQMTLFTIEGLIRAKVRSSDALEMLAMAYSRWLLTQSQPDAYRNQRIQNNGWLITVKRLHSLRAPGNTCLGALLASSSLRAENHSKGCGGVMRSAPFGIVCDDPYEAGVEGAAITHGHPLGQIPSGYLALIVHRILHGGETILEAIQDRDPHLAHARELREGIEVITNAAQTGETLPIEDFGEGWVGDEALAMSICAAVQAQDFAHGIGVAVNHSGDSDSTGAIAGNILGAHLGLAAIPCRFIETLELREEILELANDLYDIFFESTFNGQPLIGDGFSGEVTKALTLKYPGH